MSYQLYELLAYLGRYWFALLGVLIMLRSFWWLHQDRKEKHRRLKQLPDAGLIGELQVLAGNEELPEGTLLSLPLEGTLGYQRGNDIVLPITGVAKQHLDFYFEAGSGLFLRPAYGCRCEADGTVIHRKGWRDQEPLRHGSILKVGAASLQVLLFEGIETGGHGQFQKLYEQDAPTYTFQPFSLQNDPSGSDQEDWRELY